MLSGQLKTSCKCYLFTPPKVVIVLECLVSNARNGQPVDGARNSHVAAGAGIPGNGDSSILGHVSELRLRRDRQRKEQEGAGHCGQAIPS